jgi:hypothetical protein
MTGKAKNIGRDGRINQNVDSACIAIRSVSRHNHMIPRIETSGKEAIRPPTLGLRRAASDTIITMIPESAA